MGYIGGQIFDIVEPQFLKLSNIKHLMSERVQNFMLALHPSLLVTLNNNSFTLDEVLHYNNKSPDCEVGGALSPILLV